MFLSPGIRILVFGLSFYFIKVAKFSTVMLVDRFDCEEVFNDFFKEQAKTWMAEGGTVTYVMVDKKRAI